MFTFFCANSFQQKLYLGTYCLFVQINFLDILLSCESCLLFFHFCAKCIQISPYYTNRFFSCTQKHFCRNCFCVQVAFSLRLLFFQFAWFAFQSSFSNLVCAKCHSFFNVFFVKAKIQHKILCMHGKNHKRLAYICVSYFTCFLNQHFSSIQVTSKVDRILWVLQFLIRINLAANLLQTQCLYTELISVKDSQIMVGWPAPNCHIYEGRSFKRIFY